MNKTLSLALWKKRGKNGLCFVTEYDSDTSCHYKVELSYENFITSGPDPHPPPIADDESDDDDDDDIPQVRPTAWLMAGTWDMAMSLCEELSHLSEMPMSSHVC